MKRNAFGAPIDSKVEMVHASLGNIAMSIDVLARRVTEIGERVAKLEAIVYVVQCAHAATRKRGRGHRPRRR